MTAPLKEPCPACDGDGSVPHQKRIMENGEPDPTDFKVFDLCERCGGGGKVETDLKAVQERKPGYIADQI